MTGQRGSKPTAPARKIAIGDLFSKYIAVGDLFSAGGTIAIGDLFSGRCFAIGDLFLPGVQLQLAISGEFVPLILHRSAPLELNHLRGKLQLAMYFQNILQLAMYFLPGVQLQLAIYFPGGVLQLAIYFCRGHNCNWRSRENWTE